MPFRFGIVALPWGVMCLILLGLAAFIYVRQRVSRVARLFCLMILLVAVWFAGFALMLAATVPDAAMLAARFALLAVAILPAAVYDFTATAVRLYDRRRGIIFGAYGIGSLFALLILATDVVIASLLHWPWGYYPRFGPLGLAFIVYYIIVLTLALAEFGREYVRTSDPARRRRLLKLIISFAIVYVAAIDFVPMFGVAQRPIGYLPVLGFILFAWGSIRRHRLHAITAARAASEILDTMADALFVIDADAKIRIVNGAVKTAFGFTEAELVGKTIDTLEYVDLDQTFSKTLREMLRRAPIRDEERIFRHRDGRRLDVSISVSPVMDGEEAVGAVVIVRDIAERKRAQHAAHEFLTKLQQSNRELEDFAYVASHDLQEPLRKIQAFGDRLKTKYAAQLTGEGTDYIERMQSAAKRMQILINDLLTFSRVTTQGKPFVPVDLNVIAKEVVHDLEVRIHQLHGTVTLRELPSVDADALQMRQLLQNLIGNALKFHRQDVPPVVTVEGSTHNGTVELAVIDNGIGFEERYAEKVFTMFERLHGRGVYEGTGIGLAICRKIAQRHGGDIRAFSTPGAGSRFIVTLPQQHRGDVVDA